MAIFSANNPVKTVAIHKDGCHRIPREKLQPCGCGDRGNLGNQRWYCERHITLENVNEFMNNRFWAVVFCDVCFRDQK